MVTSPVSKQKLNSEASVHPINIPTCISRVQTQSEVKESAPDQWITLTVELPKPVVVLFRRPTGKTARWVSSTLVPEVQWQCWRSLVFSKKHRVALPHSVGYILQHNMHFDKNGHILTNFSHVAIQILRSEKARSTGCTTGYTNVTNVSVTSLQYGSSAQHR